MTNNYNSFTKISTNFLSKTKRGTPTWKFPATYKSIPYVGIIQIRLWVEGRTFLSARIRAPRLWNCKIKTGDTFPDASCKKSHCKMTSYGGITRIRLKGRSSSTSSQPAIQAPLYLFVEVIIYQIPGKCKYYTAMLLRELRTSRRMFLNPHSIGVEWLF